MEPGDAGSFPTSGIKCFFIRKDSVSGSLSLSVHSSLYIYVYIYIALWCKNQIEHSIWDESLLFSNCACSLEYSSSSTLAGLSYHICGKLEVAFNASPSSQHQHCSKLTIVIYLAIYSFLYALIKLFI